MKLKRTPSIDPALNLFLRFLVKRSDRQGFTLIELLVSMIITSLIVVGLLSVVVNILQTNQRDASRSDTQRDIQMAMDYIARDVREATYVYGASATESCLHNYNSAARTRGQAGQCTGLLAFLPSFLTVDDNRPVLAFWKPEPLPDGLRRLCKTSAASVGIAVATGAEDPLGKTPCVAQRMYTLVVYSINKEEPTTGFRWSGKSRITRYQLPHFTESAALGAISGGWASPIAKDKRPLTWPIGTSIDLVTNVGIKNDNVQNTKVAMETNPALNMVLTDFLDDKTEVYQAGGGHCPIGFESPSGVSSLIGGKTFNSAFYACVRSGNLAGGGGGAFGEAVDAANSAGQGINAEVHLVLRGNAAGRGGIPVATGDVPFQMETRVMSRGVFGKLAN